MQVDRNSLLTDTVVVEEVLILEPAMTFEWSLRGSNLGTIQENVKRNTRSGSDDNDQEKDAKALRKDRNSISPFTSKK